MSDYQKGVADGIRFAKTHIETYSTTGSGEKYKEEDIYFVQIKPDRVNPGELTPGSAAHRERSIEIWVKAALDHCRALRL